MYRKRSYKKKSAPYKKRGYKKRAPRKRSSLVKTIKRVIHSQIENKIVSQYNTNVILTYANTTGVSATPSFINLNPNISQGVTSSQRLGCQIRIMKGVINGYVNLLLTSPVVNPSTSPVYVKMWLCRRKATNQGVSGVPAATDFNSFFQSGSTSLGFQGSMLDMVFKTNSEVWSVLQTKTCCLSTALSQTGVNIINGNSGRCSVPFNFSFAKHLGLIRYNDNSTPPYSKELYLVFQTIWADGTSSNVTAYQMAEIHFNVEWTFEDA